MGLIKKAIPAKLKTNLLEKYNDRFPEGWIRKNTANIVTVLGGMSVAAGAVLDVKGKSRAGAALRAFGQLADDVDGDISLVLGSESKTGYLADSIIDKLKMLIKLVTLYRHAQQDQDILPSRKLQLGFIAGKHVVNAGLSAYMEYQGHDPDKNWYGKANMWADGMSVSAWGIADVSTNKKFKAFANTVGNGFFAIGAVLGPLSSLDYMKQVKNLNQQPVPQSEITTE